MRLSKAGKQGWITKGFTLVELMVVVAIIIVLAALAFGMGKKALTKARLTASIGKVRDIGGRVLMYSGDHAGMLPVYHSDESNLYWWGMIVENPKNDSELEIFHSPNDKAFNVKKIENTISYGWNAAVVGRSDSSSGDDSDQGPKRVSSFTEPNRVLVLADGPEKGNKGLLTQELSPDPKRYDGKAAVLLLDGSAKDFNIEGEFHNNNKWFVDPEKQNNQ